MRTSQIIRRAPDSFHLRAGTLTGRRRQEPLERVKNLDFKGLAADGHCRSTHRIKAKSRFVAKLRQYFVTFHTVTISPHFVVFESSCEPEAGQSIPPELIFSLLISALAESTYTILEYQ